MTEYALIIGANSAIGKAVIEQLVASDCHKKVYAVSRTALDFSFPNLISVVMDTSNETEITQWLAQISADEIRFSEVVCCIGTLHDETVFPEKRLEDVTSKSLSHYFDVNTITPFLWVSHLVDVVSKNRASITVLSARVGSISDNKLGGWYGYRASKAALNMLMKTASVEYARRSPNTVLMCYHPGTVESPLSAPFKKNVKPTKLFTPQYTAQCLLSLSAKLLPENNPSYVDYQGQLVSW